MNINYSHKQQYLKGLMLHTQKSQTQKNTYTMGPFI